MGQVQFSQKVVDEGLTFDDVLLLPRYSEVLPQSADLQCQLTRDLTIKLPILSAAMDTVTEKDLAIGMAQAGGVGIIHRNMTIEEQAAQVYGVKKSESGMITDPVTIRPDASVGEARELMAQKNISGLPVVVDGLIEGIVTGRDIKFEGSSDRIVSEVMTKKVITTDEHTPLVGAIEILHQHRVEKLPVVRRGTRELIGMFTMRDIEKARTHPEASKDTSGRLLVGAAIGVNDDVMDRVEALMASSVDVLVLDTAHGHSVRVLQTLKKIVQTFPRDRFQIIAGNVATSEGAGALVEAGADGVKVGMGPGSICTTRVITGMGVPQLTAVMKCAEACAAARIPVIADGGIKFSGDIVKALAGGANTVMIGSLLAGTEEAPGEVVLYKGKGYKTYRGMGSLGAMSGGKSKDRYMQDSVTEAQKIVPEGVEGRKAVSGPLATVLQQYVGGIRQAFGYLGVRSIGELHEHAKFLKISRASLVESHVHDVQVTREAPNYRVEQ